MADDYNDIPTRKDSLYPPGTLNPRIWNKGGNQQSRPGLLRKSAGIISGGSYGALEARLEQLVDFVEGLGWDPGSNGPYKAQVLGPYVSASGLVGYITIPELRQLGCTFLTNWLSKLSSKADVPTLLPAVYATIPELDVARPIPQAHGGMPALGVSGDALAIKTYILYIGDYSDTPAMPHDGSIIEVDFFDNNPTLSYGIFKSIVVDADLATAYNFNSEEAESASSAFAGSGAGLETMGENEHGQDMVGIGTKEQRQANRDSRKEEK